MANDKNLTPWKPGQSGNPAGKPKGTRHLSTVIQEMLDDPNFSYVLADGKKKKGSAIEAMVKTMMIKAISGDVRAFDTLAKYGYGNKLDLTSNLQTLPMPLLGGLYINEVEESTPVG